MTAEDGDKRDGRQENASPRRELGGCPRTTDPQRPWLRQWMIGLGSHGRLFIAAARHASRCRLAETRPDADQGFPHFLVDLCRPLSADHISPQLFGRMASFRRKTESGGSMSSLGPTKVVFIAEDDADFRAALGATLTEAGLRVVLFPTAEKLLRSLDRATPAVIVTDVSMPGLSGPELLHRLRLDERWQRIPVVVMTANNDTALPIRLNVPVVYKPDTEGLVAVIQRLPTANLNEEETMTRYTLPDLPYAYDALEPHISAEIMELHHDKHHRAYVDGANQAIDKLIDGRSRRDYSQPRRPSSGSSLSMSPATSCTASSGAT